MDYVNFLKNSGLKVTPQRLSVLKALDLRTHPSVDELYEMLRAENPSISLATVYKNLNTLKDEGLVVEVNVPNQKARYDIFAHPHIHIVCDSCGHISDLDYSTASVLEYSQELADKLGAKITSLNIVASVESCEKCKGF